MARTQFSIATMNLYNLNRPGQRIYSDADGWPQDQYDLKIEWTARQLREIGADIWGFQELWDGAALAQAVEVAGLADDYVPLVPEGQTGQRIVCAGLVRRDILVGEPVWIDRFPEDFKLHSSGEDAQTPEISVLIDAFSRPVLHYKVKPRRDGKVIEVFVCHFKSKRPTQIWREGWYTKAAYSRHAEAIGAGLSTVRRTAEATALRMIVTEVVKGTDTPVVVMGDLNDDTNSNTLNIVTGQPNYLLSGLSEGGSDSDLYTVGTLQRYRSQRDVYYTHVYQNKRESLDQILVSQEFYDNSKKRIWAFKGMTVFNDHLNDEDHKDTGTADHGIVRAQFEYRPR